MKKVLCNCLFLLLLIGLQAQTVSEIQTFELKGKVNLKEMENDVFPVLHYLEAPSPGGNQYRAYRDALKEEMADKFIKKPKPQSSAQKSPDLNPEVLRNFRGARFTTGIPLDNSMAISNDGIVVNTMNSHIYIFDTEGEELFFRSLSLFSSSLNLPGREFDPRVIYDPEQDRFIIVFLAGSECPTSDIVFAFSETNDPTGNWNLYSIGGCPFNGVNWTDFPMIALTKEEFFLTVNLIIPNEPWQLGFAETLIYQIDKSSGYNGEDLVLRTWNDIKFNDQPIRYLHPVKAAGEELQDNLYLLSSRVLFDTSLTVEDPRSYSNDTIMILEINQLVSEPNPVIDIDFAVADQSYIMPPFAEQNGGNRLQTNDCRILDAFVLNDEIQFVGNTQDPNTNLAAFYHGYIRGIDGDQRSVNLNILTDGTSEYGYPGIAWTGLTEAETNAIIVASHGGANRFPGHSVMYVEDDGSYSDFVSTKEGESFLDLLPDNQFDYERWGDYIGIQRMYNDPGRVWVASSHTTDVNRYGNWISEISKPGFISSNNNIFLDQSKLQLAPNPTSSEVQVNLEIPDGTQNLKFQVHNIGGQLIRNIDYGLPTRSGAVRFFMNTMELAKGNYVLSAYCDSKLISSKQLVVQ